MNLYLTWFDYSIFGLSIFFYLQSLLYNWKRWLVLTVGFGFFSLFAVLQSTTFTIYWIRYVGPQFVQIGTFWALLLFGLLLTFGVELYLTSVRSKRHHFLWGVFANFWITAVFSLFLALDLAHSLKLISPSWFSSIRLSSTLYFWKAFL